MVCVNTNSKQYKDLVKGLEKREQLVARAVISKYLTDNNTETLPDFVTLKSLISDLYNTNKSGLDYQAFYSEVRNMFKRAIPSLTEKDLDDRVRFIDKLDLIRLRSGKEVLSTFIDNVVYISKTLPQERGEEAIKDIRHEIFHTIFNNYLNLNEQDALMQSFKRWMPQYSSIQDKEELEEAMAEAYESWQFSSSIPTLIRDFFIDLLRFLRIISDQYTDVRKLFDDVENGKFTRNYIKDSLVTRDKSILIFPEFSTDLDLFLQTKSFMLNNLNELMFPTDSQNLSEVNNQELFLKQDYKSPLFSNNRDIFKLGLTKETALMQLQKRVKALRDSKTTDPQLARVVHVLSKPHIFKALFDYLQPYSVAEVADSGELVLKSQVQEDQTVKEMDNFNDDIRADMQIGSKELINPTTKISEVVKDFLSSVTYETTPGNFVNIDPGAGFISLLNLLGNLYGNTSLEDNMDSLKDNYNSTTKGNQTKAVYNKLRELHDNVINYNKLSLNIKGVPQAELDNIRNQMDDAGIKYEIFKDNLNIVIPDNMYIENVGTNNVDNVVRFTFNRYNEGKQSFLIEQTRDKNGNLEANKTFIEKIANQTRIPNFIISRLFQYNEQRNTLAELTKVAGSLRKLSPKFVRVSTTRVDSEDGSTNVTSFAFINRVNEYRASGSLASTIRTRLDILPLRESVIKDINKYKSLKDKTDKKALRNLLEDIIVNKIGVVTKADLDRISDKDVNTLLNNLERIATFVPEFSSNVDSTEFKEHEVYLKHTSNLGNSLQKYTYEKNNPTSFQVSTARKSKWENQMPNTSFKHFKNLEQFATGVIKAAKLLPFFRDSRTNYLRFNPLIVQDYSSSEFSINQNLLKTGEDDFYADHQETYFENNNSNYETPPIPFSKETSRDWINRNFIAMFQLPILESLTGNKKTERSNIAYYQQKFQPESAPNVSVIKMGINSSEELQNSIMYMILQEAYMQHLSSSSGRSNLIKNTKKSLIPGLEGSTYFLNANGENIFFDADGNLDPKFGTVQKGKLVIDNTNSLLKSLSRDILDNLDNSLGEFVELAITEKATLDGNSLSNMYDKIKNTYLDNYKLSEEDLSTLRGISIDPNTDTIAFRKSENFQNQKEVLKKAMSSYYLNSFVNGFFMNQLSSGSTQNYKNPLDEVKRQAGVNAMNDTGLIDNKHGMINNYRNVVIEASNIFYGQSNPLIKIPVLRRFFLNKKNEVGDAQSWDIPEYKTLLRKSFGKSVDIGVITKDVHFEINENGGVDYRKTSSAELTNELVKDNKTLRDLRFALTFQPYLNTLDETSRQTIEPRIRELYNNLVDNNGLSNIDDHMEYQNYLEQAAPTMIHKASFESAIKGSKPARMSSFTKNKETGTFDLNLEQQSVLNLNSAYNGIQQAVRHRYIDSFISHFTQLTYLIGLNRTETSIKNNKIITSTLAKFAKAGIYDMLFDYRMTYGEDKLLRVNGRSRRGFREDMLKKLDLPGNERLVSFLSTNNISMNNPLFSEKLMQNFFNSLTKKTVNPKHPGGSFVLQSEFGFEASNIVGQNSLKRPELKVDKDGNILYAECYLPAMYDGQIKANDLLYYDNDQYNNMFGFRIPSSDLHSSVPLKVIGFYPSSMHDNVVVIPAAVTSLHGSDFDVDKLFIVRQGVFNGGQEEIDPKNPDQDPQYLTNKREYKTRFQTENKIIAQKGIKYGYTLADAIYDNAGNLIGFGNNVHNEINNLENILIDEKQKTQARIIVLEVEQANIIKLNKQSGLTQREVLANISRAADLVQEISKLNRHLKIVKDIQKGLYSNRILDSVLDNISYSGENAPDIFMGITFDPVKGYEEDSEYSRLAEVISKNNKAKGIESTLAPRPRLYNTVKEVQDNDPDRYTKFSKQLDNMGINLETKEGQEDLVAIINDDIKDSWTSARDEFIRGNKAVNINKVEQHANIHKETYMASGLVGLIANFSKGLAYAFHGITDGSNEIQLEIPENEQVVIDGVRVSSLTLENKDGIKNQELKSLVLNAAIDHVKEQILNVLNVGNNTAKIFLATISTKLNLNQATMLMLQPVAKELNSSDATTSSRTLKTLETQVLTALNDLGQDISQPQLDAIEVTTKELEKLIQTTLPEILNNPEDPNYKKNLMLQYKVIQQLKTLDKIGQEVSDVSGALSIIQGLPYNLETAYDKLDKIDKFIDVDKLYSKLAYTEKSEYGDKGFKDDLKSTDTIFSNVNLGLNENVLGALEAIKTQIDVSSELFSENSVQLQFMVNTILKAIADNSDPTSMFQNMEELTFDTRKNMSIKEKYLKGKNTYIITRLLSRNMLNFLTSGLNMRYNNNDHVFSMSIQDQKLQNIEKDEEKIALGPVRSFLGQFLMKEKDIINNEENYLVSQINPKWRLKPLSLIKKENSDNKFLRSLGIDFNFRDKVNILTFNSDLVNTAENMAEIEQAVNDINQLRNIYVTQDDQGNWIELPSNEHPYTPEMSEIIFNILKTSLYTDKFKFSSNKATNVLPVKYFTKLFSELNILTRDLLEYKKSDEGTKYYTNYADRSAQEAQESVISGIKENIFINTIFSIPSILPNIKGKYNFDNKKNAGILPNGNIYDLFIDASKLEQNNKEDQVQNTQAPINPNETLELKDIDNTNQEIEDEVSEATAENDLYNKFRKNPSFLVDQDPKRANRYELFMKVGQTGTKEGNDLKYYYKKVGNIDSKVTNNSFDTNLLINKYEIKDHFNPKRFAIPIRDIDINQDKVSLSNVNISSFIINAADSTKSQKVYKQQVQEDIEQQFQVMRADPNNVNKSDDQLRKSIKTRINIENIINQVNEVSLYDSRNIDRVGIRNFKIVSRKISDNKRTIDLELEALPDSQQVTLNKFDNPLIVNDKTTRQLNELSREEKIKRINATPGVQKVLTGDNLSDAEVDLRYERVLEIEDSSEINKVLKNKSCN